MENLIRLNCFLYSRLLVFYPRELRQKFGTHMVEVFEDLLLELPPRRAAAAYLSLWRIALWELASVGVLSRLQSTAFIAAAASVLFSSLLMWSFFRVMGV